MPSPTESVTLLHSLSAERDHSAAESGVLRGQGYHYRRFNEPVYKPRLENIHMTPTRNSLKLQTDLAFVAVLRPVLVLHG
jgi:hypothetical protein